MKRTNFTYFIISICAITILSIIIISIIGQNEQENHQLAEKITDECTEEWSEYIASVGKVTQTNSKDNIVSPNAKIIFNNYYKSCGHIDTIEEFPSEDVVNMYEEQLKEKYSDYDIQEFLNEKISLYKEIEGFCDEHYLLIEEQGYLTIYKIENNGDKILFSKTNVSLEYLTDTDNVQLKQGIYVYGLEELNRTLEDFE